MGSAPDQDGLYSMTFACALSGITPPIFMANKEFWCAAPCYKGCGQVAQCANLPCPPPAGSWQQTCAPISLSETQFCARCQDSSAKFGDVTCTLCKGDTPNYTNSNGKLVCSK